MRIVRKARGETGDLMADNRKAASSTMRRSIGKRPVRARQASAEVDLNALRMTSAISL